LIKERFISLATYGGVLLDDGVMLAVFVFDDLFDSNENTFSYVMERRCLTVCCCCCCSASAR